MHIRAIWSAYIRYAHGLVVAVVDDSALLTAVLALLELKVLLKHRREAVALQQPRLPAHLLVLRRNFVKVVQQGHVVA